MAEETDEERLDRLEREEAERDTMMELEKPRETSEWAIQGRKRKQETESLTQLFPRAKRKKT